MNYVAGKAEDAIREIMSVLPHEQPTERDEQAFGLMEADQERMKLSTEGGC